MALLLFIQRTSKQVAPWSCWALLHSPAPLIQVGWVQRVWALAVENLTCGSMERSSLDSPLGVKICRKRAFLGDGHGLLVLLAGAVCEQFPGQGSAAWAMEAGWHRLQSRQTCTLLTLLCPR